MVNKITFETINSKIGKPGDPASLEDVVLANKQIDEIGSFAKFAKLKKLDLSNNRIRFKRNVEGLFQAPALEELDLRGNPVCNEVGYRAYMIEGIKTLKVLDGVPVGSELDQKPAQNNQKKSSLFDDNENESENLFANHPLNKNVTSTTVVPVKETEVKKIPAKTSPTKEDTKKGEDHTNVVSAIENSKVLPKEEKKAQIDISDEKHQESSIPKQEKPAEKFEKKSTAQAEPVSGKKPAQIEKPKPVQKTENTSKEDKPSASNSDQSNTGVFRDSRSKLEISTKLHEGIQAPEPLPVEVEQPKKEMLTEDSLFGAKKSLFQEDVAIDRSLLEITDVPQKKPSVQKQTPKPAAKVTIAIDDDEDDDLFGTKPKNTSNKKTSVASGDDLFDLVSTNKKDAVDLSKLNIDEYLASQTSANDSLFD